MEKQEIINLLEEKHQSLFDWINQQPKEKWTSAPENKWTPGQHVSHLVNSMQKLNTALRYPKFLLKYKFGTSNRAVREYDEVVNRYQTKLAKNQDKAKAFNAHVKAPSLQEQKRLLTTLQIQQKKLQYKTRKWKDKDLDNIILPHPLLGKMPVREMIMFMGYHTEHHLKNLERDFN